MKKVTAPVIFLFLASIGLVAHADNFTESNRKIAYLKETGSGAEGKSAAIKLDTTETMSAQCFEDIIIFDASTETGKKTMATLSAALKSKTALKTITFSKNEEGDCVLIGVEK